MASKRRIRKKSCQGKRRFEDPQEAQQLAMKYGLVMYKCKFSSKHFHIGHPPKKIRISIAARKARNVY